MDLRTVIGVALTAGLLASTAQAAITISTGQTENITCADKVCAPIAADAVLNVSDLVNLLASSNIEVTTTATDAEAKDIVVATPLSWASRKNLELRARRTVEIDQPVTVEGTAGLVLKNGAHHGGDLVIQQAGSVTFWDTGSSLVINKDTYVLVKDIGELARKVAKNPIGAFALAKSYDAARDGTYSSTPVPSFSGIFEGLGNTISNLTISDSTSGAVGLFGGEVAGGAREFRDIGLVNANVSSSLSHASNAVYVGALVGYTTGTIENAFSTGAVSSTATGSDTGIGGLAGSGAVILNSYSAANVTVAGATASTTAGGLAGDATDIEYSHASGAISVAGAGYGIGGLAGIVSADPGLVIDSYATGPVTTSADGSAYQVGGLVGTCCGISGHISESFATGTVQHGVWVGGLLGSGSVPILNSYATGSVTTGPDQGGGAGAGGLIGIGNSPPTSPISYSYAIGAVSGPTPAWTAGFDGYVDGNSGAFNDCYWDIETSQQTLGVGGSGAGGVTPLTTEQFMQSLPPGFDQHVWAVDRRGTKNGGFPYLRKNPPPQ